MTQSNDHHFFDKSDCDFESSANRHCVLVSGRMLATTLIFAKMSSESTVSVFTMSLTEALSAALGFISVRAVVKMLKLK